MNLWWQKTAPGSRPNAKSPLCHRRICGICCHAGYSGRHGGQGITCSGNKQLVRILRWRECGRRMGHVGPFDIHSGAREFFSPGCFPPLSGCAVNTIDVQNAGAQTTHARGFTGGAQAGYNLQSGNIVYGIETDLQSFRADGSSSRTVNVVSGIAGKVTVGSSISTAWLFTLRPRAGVVVNNNWLFYVTGGLAVSELKSGLDICRQCVR